MPMPHLQNCVEKLDATEVGSAPIRADDGAEPVDKDMEATSTTAWVRLCNRELSATELTMARKVL
jgi:hypothetical protein